MRDATESINEDPSSRERIVFRPGDSIRSLTLLMTEVLGGTAGSVADGFQAFGDELTRQSVRERGLFNALFEGAIAGQSRFLRSLAETGDRVQESFRDLETEPRERVVQEPIDYERLAKALARAIRKEEDTELGDTNP